MLRSSRRGFLAWLARVGMAVALTPVATARRVLAASAPLLSGPSSGARSVWVGRGCSATSSATTLAGGVPAAPYDIDFGAQNSVVVGGISLPSLSIIEGVVTAGGGSSWALETVRRGVTSVALVGDGTSIVANAEGG